MRIRWLLITSCALAVSITAHAQTDPSLSQGIIPYQSYQGGEVDNINLSNGVVTARIPLIAYPQRGQSLKLTFSSDYYGKILARELECAPPANTQCFYVWMNSTIGNKVSVPFWGTNLVDDQQVGFGIYGFDYESGGEPVVDNIAQWMSSDGALHHSVLLGGNGGGTGQISMDGTGFYVPLAYDGTCTGSCPTTDANGISYFVPYLEPSSSQPVLREDPNGNEITEQLSSSGILTGLKDTVGRIIPVQSSTTDYSGCTGPLPTSSALVWQVPGGNGGTLTYKFCYAQVSICIPGELSNPCGPAIPNQGGYPIYGDQSTVTDLQSIVLPNNQNWTFEYSSRNPGDPDTVNYGDLTEIIFPTGGSVTYQYQLFEVSPNGSNVYSMWVTSRTVDAADGTGPHTWTYNYSGLNSNIITTTVADPLGEQTVHTFNVPSAMGYESETQIYSGTAGSSQLLKTIQRSFTLNISGNPDINHTYPAIGAFPNSITTILDNGMKSLVSTQFCCAVTTGWVGENIFETGTSTYGLPNDVQTYDYGSGSQGTLLREDKTTYEWQNNNAYYTANLLNLVAQKTTCCVNASLVAQTNYTYDESAYLTGSGISTQHGAAPYAVRGNLTTTIETLNTGPNPTSHTNWYDTGEPYKHIDPKGNTTTYGYSSTYSGALPTTVTNALGQITSYGYDVDLGLKTSATDPNNQTTSDSYDTLGRLKTVVYPDVYPGSTTQGETSYTYNDAVPPVVSVSKVLSPTATEQFELDLDGLGRLQTTKLLSDPVAADLTVTTYDPLGRTASVTNPYRSTSDPTYGLTTYSYDALNRKHIQQNQDGSSDTWTYSGETATFSDEIGNTWNRTTDALGRLTSVVEPSGGTTTSYSYDGLSNLATVSEVGSPGTESRSFVYDSLSRLASAANPESGTTGYTYDADGNLLTRTDARGIRTTYGSDSLNRLIGKQYSDGTPSVAYLYDQPSPALGSNSFGNFVGRLSEADTIESGTPLLAYVAIGYDAVGRSMGFVECGGSSACINNGTVGVFLSGSEYDLVGSPITLQGGVINSLSAPTTGEAMGAVFTYDSAERLNSVEGAVADVGSGAPFVPLFTATSTSPTSPAYSPLGGLMNAQMAFNSQSQAQILLSRGYDSRGRVSTETDTNAQGGTVYSYGLGYSLNSNLTSFSDFLMGQWALTYDNLSRLTGGVVTAGTYNNLALSWSYDSFSNRQQQTVLTEPSAPVPGSSWMHYNLANQVSGSNVAPAGFVYDAAGHVLKDGVNRYVYDAEGRICATQEITTGGMTEYVYDAEGERVGKGSISSLSCNMLSNGFTASAEYILGPDGEVLAQVDPSLHMVNANVYANGRMLATNTNSTWYYELTDWVGSKRVEAEGNGSVAASFLSLPYGDGLTEQGSPDASPLHFTGKQRDTESGNDYFGARYYSSSTGRWMVPDWSAVPEAVPYANLNDPQTLNLYAYVGNNPLTHTDVDGHYLAPVGNGGFAVDAGADVAANGTSVPGGDAYNSMAGQAAWAYLTGGNPAQAAHDWAQQPLSSVSVLGRTVGINYGKGLSLADELAASGKIGAAAGLIDANADSLTASEKKAIGQISSFTVAGPGTYLGATGKGSMTLSAGYIEASSAAWVGSLFGHEGQHYLNAGKYSGDNLWRDEQSAGRTQLGIGNKIGFGSSESRYLEQWIDDRNRNAMQQHMQQGYSY